MTAYNPERFIPDTSSTGDDSVSDWRVPVPPAEWGPGAMVRMPAYCGWQWVPPPPAESRWAQPPPGDVHLRGDRARSGPIAVGSWSDGGNTVRVSGRMLWEQDSLVIAGTAAECISISIARCDVATWGEARDKDRIGELMFNRTQAEYLRDALTAMLERKP